MENDWSTPRTCVCLSLLLATGLFAGVSRATPQLEVGRYVDNTWYHAQTLTDISGPVQLRCVLSWSDQPPTHVVFALVPSIPGGELLLSDATEAFPEGQTMVFVSAPFGTPLRCDQGYDAMATVVIPDGAPPPPQPPPPPPGGDPPGGGAPPIGTDWGAGPYPPADPDNNDIHLEAIEFTAKNLSLSDIRVVDPPNVASVYEPFVLLTNQAPADIHWEGDMDDGFELPTSATTVGTLYLHPLQSNLADAESTDPTGMPPETQFAGVFPDQAGGFYYWNLTGAEPTTGDSTQYLSEYLVVDQASTVWVATDGIRRASVQVRVGTSDGGAQTPMTTAKYIWCEPDGSSVTCVGGTVPFRSGLLSVEVIDSFVFEHAGEYGLGITYQDTPRANYHNGQARWAWPGVAALAVPAAVCFSGKYRIPGFDDMKQDAIETVYCLLGYVQPATDPPGMITFYAGRPALGSRGGVAPHGTKQDFLEALRDDDVIYYTGHAYVGSPALETSDGQDVWATDVTNFGPPGYGDQARLVWLSACGTFYNAPYSISNTIHAHSGARAVVGFDNDIYIPVSVLFDKHVFRHLTQDPLGVADAIAAAMIDTERDTVIPLSTAGITGVRCDPPGYSGLIAPAFTL